jgi:hypothetical protein
MPKPFDVPPSRRSSRLFLRSLWALCLSVRRHDLSGHAHAGANVVLCDLSFRDDAARRFSGKELQRELGVTYKTAWRIGHQVRKLMEQADIRGLLIGHVELDEAYVGGRAGKRGRGAAGKTIVMGMVGMAAEKLRSALDTDLGRRRIEQAYNPEHGAAGIREIALPFALGRGPFR